jgi:hypothetical protein
MKQSKLFENKIEFDPYEYMMISPNEKTELIIKHFMSINKGEIPNYIFIQNLIEMGANLEYLDKKFGESVLHYACTYNDIKLVEILLDNGVDINIKEKNGNTPLFSVAQNYKGIDIARLLLERGADIQAKNDITGCTALHIASEYANIEVAKLLLDAGANPNAKDDNGNTPLHYIMERESVELATLLLEYGGDVNRENNDGETPLDASKKLWRSDIHDLFIEQSKLSESASLDYLDIIAMSTEKRQKMFDEEITYSDIDYDLLQMMIDTGEIEVSYEQLLGLNNTQLSAFLLNDNNKKYLKINDIFTSDNFPKEYFASVREIKDMVIFERDYSEIKGDNDFIFYEYEFKESKLFKESRLIPISLMHPYTVYYPEDDTIFLFDFDIEYCFAGDKSKILEMVEDREYIWMSEVLNEWLTPTLFNIIKNDEKVQSQKPKDLKYNESTNSYDLYLKDYEDLAELYPDEEDTVKKIFNGDIYYDYYHSYENYFFDELDSKTEDLLRSIIKEKNPEVDVDEIDSSKGLKIYISNSDDDIAEKIKESIERAYNRAYESAYQDALQNHVSESAYEWLTGNSYNKNTSFKYDDGHVIVRDIRLDLVIVSLFSNLKNSNFIDCLDFNLLEDLEDSNPEVNFDRAENNVYIDSDWFLENLQECLLEEGVLDYDGEIFKNYNSKK